MLHEDFSCSTGQVDKRLSRSVRTHFCFPICHDAKLGSSSEQKVEEHTKPWLGTSSQVVRRCH